MTQNQQRGCGENLIPLGCLISSRLSRQKHMKEYSAAVRTCQDSQSRKKRLTTQRDYALGMREEESPRSRELRLTAMKDHTTETSESKSPQSRELRLNNIEHVYRPGLHSSETYL
ncbi:hypothetical protein ABEB36_015671 [Hypothenemus hampei]|uniref:Uncharacterized protein n=1 Tax=Hypothenemus hampei TaxID=57062 RepID=A0ABD1DZG0_HYPHA